MCGIAGYFSTSKPPQEKIVKQMCNQIVHRGPDDEGYYSDESVVLGVRRLSIIDLAGGHQPIHNEDKTLWIVFNGEIYNFPELREELIKKGHSFYTNTDTETIVHLYEEMGEKCPSKLNGMFAFAIWDSNKKTLYMARDRVGKKPLYYYNQKGQFVFGSEVKCILAHPAVSKELDIQSLSRYLTYEYVPCPYSIFKNIYKLEPGHYLIKKTNTTEITQYWDLDFGKYDLNNEEEMKTLLDRELDRAVRMRMIADVPLGIFLSGGLDSTTIAYYMLKASPGKVKSYSIGFNDPSFDESKYARLAAKALGTDHHEQILEVKDMYELIPVITQLLDEPFADASIIPTYLLSEFTRTEVTVALGGDGNDELFMGYPTFQAHKLAKIYELIPDLIRRNIIHPFVQKLPTSYSNISLDFKLKKFTDAFNYSERLRHQLWLGTFTEDKKQKLLKPEISQQIPLNLLINDLTVLPKLNTLNYWDRIIYLYCKQYLLDDILVKVDRASMFTSLEVRAPFLDYKVVDVINSFPTEKKLKHLKTKYLLKKMMSEVLPKEIVYRSKKGFGIPVAKWLRAELKGLTTDTLSRSKIEKQGLFNYNYVNKLFTDHLNGKSDNRKYLWTLIMFQLWYERWLN